MGINGDDKEDIRVMWDDERDLEEIIQRILDRYTLEEFLYLMDDHGWLDVIAEQLEVISEMELDDEETEPNSEGST